MLVNRGSRLESLEVETHKVTLHTKIDFFCEFFDIRLLDCEDLWNQTYDNKVVCC